MISATSPCYNHSRTKFASKTYHHLNKASFCELDKFKCICEILTDFYTVHNTPVACLYFRDLKATQNVVGPHYLILSLFLGFSKFTLAWHWYYISKPSIVETIYIIYMIYSTRKKASQPSRRQQGCWRRRGASCRRSGLDPQVEVAPVD